MALVTAALWLGQSWAPVLVPAGTHPWAVSSSSMEPTLREGEVVLGNRPVGVCGTTIAELGDLVLVRRQGSTWLRRLIAGPGQTVQMVNNQLVIDGVEVAREEVSRDGNNSFGLPVFVYRETLPNGRSHLVQDFGPGQALDDTPVFRLEAGQWFTMGDNRDNAIDGRVDGPTAAADLCGTVVRILRSPDPERVGSAP